MCVCIGMERREREKWRVGREEARRETKKEGDVRVGLRGIAYHAPEHSVWPALMVNPTLQLSHMAAPCLVQEEPVLGEPFGQVQLLAMLATAGACDPVIMTNPTTTTTTTTRTKAPTATPIVIGRMLDLRTLAAMASAASVLPEA